MNADNYASDATLTRQDWRRLLKISDNTLSKLIKDGKVPQPLPLGGRCQRWPVSDLEEVLGQTRING